MNNHMSPSDVERILSAQDLLAGSSIIHDIEVPQEILTPGSQTEDGIAGKLRLRPLSMATITLISRAARDDASLVPVLRIKESLVEPALAVDQIRQMHVGLVSFLVNRVNIISGLGADGEDLEDAVNAPLGRTLVLLAKHFGWTPEQVSQLTPGQVAVYLAGIAKLMELEDSTK